MNDELQKSIQQMIDKSVAAFEHGATIANEQIPDVIQQYLLWALTERIMMVGLAVLVCFISYKAVTKWTSQEIKYGVCDTDKELASVLGGLASLITIVAGIASIFGIVKILVAPKVFLLEKVAELIR